MIGTEEDFFCKAGFYKGTQLEERDFEARNNLIAYLNRVLPKIGLLAIEYNYDRTNPCRIIIVKLQHKLPDNIAKEYYRGKIRSRPMPEAIKKHHLDKLIRRAYDVLLGRSFIKENKWVHLACDKEFVSYKECLAHINSGNCSAVSAKSNELIEIKEKIISTHKRSIIHDKHNGRDN